MKRQVGRQRGVNGQLGTTLKGLPVIFVVRGSRLRQGDETAPAKESQGRCETSVGGIKLALVFDCSDQSVKWSAAEVRPLCLFQQTQESKTVVWVPGDQVTKQETAELLAKSKAGRISSSAMSRSLILGRGKGYLSAGRDGVAPD